MVKLDLGRKQSAIPRSRARLFQLQLADHSSSGAAISAYWKLAVILPGSLVAETLVQRARHLWTIGSDVSTTPPPGRAAHSGSLTAAMDANREMDAGTTLLPSRAQFPHVQSIHRQRCDWGLKRRNLEGARASARINMSLSGDSDNASNMGWKRSNVSRSAP
jgi:hypothetical protein